MESPLTRIERALLAIAVHAVLFLLFTLLVINVGFVFRVAISEWTLPISFATYTIGALAWHAWRAKWRPGKIAGVGMAAFMLPVLFFWVGTAGFSQTYDTTWDGQNYHQSGVIALAQGWNPLYEPKPPITVYSYETAVIGSPKALWELQASVYALMKPIEAALVVQLFLLLASAAFVFVALRTLTLSKLWASTLTLLALLTPTVIQQFFSFMGDGTSYLLILIAIANLVLMYRAQRFQPVTFIIFCSAIVLLLGIKFSNAYAIIGLLIAFLYIIQRQKFYKDRQFWLVGFTFALGAFVVLAVPYVTNTLRHSSPVYPFNEEDRRGSLRYDGVPNNIRDDQQWQLFIAGLTSRTVGGYARSDANNAHAKIPFSVHDSEFATLRNDIDHLVGGGGIWLSGTLLLSILGLLLLLAWEKGKEDRRIVRYCLLSISLILGGALITPIPSLFRYITFIWLLPIIVILGLLLVKAGNHKVRSGMAAIITLSIIGNVLLYAIPTLESRFASFRVLDEQIQELRPAPQAVKINHFYSHGNRLSERGVQVEYMGKLTCKQPIKLAYSWDTTSLCPKH